jgi:hypothetical protein
VLHGNAFADDMASKLDDVPVVLVVVLLDDAPSINDMNLELIGGESCKV